MPPSLCAICETKRALILRPKNHQKVCKECFYTAFETEIHHTITSNNLFHRGERVAVGASGGKDSTVLASVLKTLNERYDYGVDFMLLSIDEGIKGYRDDSLETVKRNAEQYGMELCIVSYDDLYGWSMDKVVETVGKKSNCTYCGVFRRQALDRGALRLGVGHVVTGHNCDDVAETVLMNLLRGDLPRLSRTTSIVTSTPSASRGAEDKLSLTNIKRSKPLKYAYEKEIVLYAHHKRLDYFSTECIYSPEAFRGSARALIKNLERIRPSTILDIVRSGEDMARLVPGSEESCTGDCGRPHPAPAMAGEEEGGCSNSHGRNDGVKMARMEELLQQNAKAETFNTESEIMPSQPEQHQYNPDGSVSLRVRQRTKEQQPPSKAKKQPAKQTMGECERCGYLSSQKVCKACVLLEGLNKNRAKVTLNADITSTQSSQVANGAMR